MSISVIIPVYNVKDYIEECIRSVMSQTYDGDLECLIVDDCGQDESIEIAKKNVEEYKGSFSFRFIHHDKNKGLSVSRNTGIENAKGEYIYFLDADDILKDNCLEQLLEVLKQHPDCEMVQGGLEIFLDEEKIIPSSNIEGLRCAFNTEKKTPTYSNRKEWIMRTFAQRGGSRGFAVTAQNRLVKRDFIIGHKLFFKEQIIHEDEVWNYMLATHITKLGICNHNTYLYRIRKNSITTQIKTIEQKIRDRFPVWDAILDDLNEHPNKIFTKMLWAYMNEFWPLEMNSETRKCFRKRFTQLMKNYHFPTTIGLWLYIHRPYSSTIGNFLFKKMMHNSVKSMRPI